MSTFNQIQLREMLRVRAPKIFALVSAHKPLVFQGDKKDKDESHTDQPQPVAKNVPLEAHQTMLG